jgi:hypothetical protein
VGTHRRERFPESQVDVFDPVIASIKYDPRFTATLSIRSAAASPRCAGVSITHLDQWVARGARTGALRQPPAANQFVGSGV